MWTPSLVLTRRGLAFEISERGLPIAKLGWLCVLDYRVDSSVNWWCTMWTHSLILTRGGLAFEISERGPSTSLLLALWATRLFAIWFLLNNQPFHHLPTYSFTAKIISSIAFFFFIKKFLQIFFYLYKYIILFFLFD